MYDDISDMHSTAFAGLNMDLFLDNHAPSVLYKSLCEFWKTFKIQTSED